MSRHTGAAGPSDGSLTPSNVVYVRGINSAKKQFTADLLELIFENDKYIAVRGGGDVERVEMRAQEDLAIITYKDPGVAARVLAQQEISYDNHVLRVSAPPATDPASVLVTGLSQNTGRDTLEMFFESKKKTGGDDIDQMDFDERRGIAVIRYKDPQVAQRVLRHGQSLSLDGASLSVQAYLLPTSVCVSPITPGDKDTLELYFESKKHSGGGDLTDIEIRNDKTAVITFADHNIIPRVLKNKHSINGRTIEVRPNNSQLSGLNGNNGNNAAPNQEDGPISVDITNSYTTSFLKKTKPGQAWLKNREFKVDWAKTTPSKICVHYDGQGTPPNGWGTDCSVRFKDLCQDIEIHSVPVCAGNVFSAVEADIKASSSSSAVLYDVDRTREEVKIVGFNTDVSKAKRALDQIVTAAQQAGTVMENEMPLNKVQLKLLELSKHADYMKSRAEGLEINIHDDIVHFKGPEEKILLAISLLFDEFIDVLVSKEHQMRGTKFSILKNVEMERFIEVQIHDNKLIAALEVDSSDNRVTVLALSQHDAEEVSKLVDRNFAVKDINSDGGGRSILDSQRWQQIKTKLLLTHKQSIIIDENPQRNQAKIICAVGINKDIESAIANLDDLKSEEKIVQMALTTWWVLHTYHSAKIHDIQEHARGLYKDSSVTVTSADPDHFSGYIIKGTKTAAIDAVASELSQLYTGVIRADERVTVATLPMFYLSGAGHQYLRSLEASHRVLCVVDDDTDHLVYSSPAPPPTQTPDSPLVGATAAASPLAAATGVIRLDGGQKLVVTGEDLRRCDVDVVMIPATETLQHTLPMVTALVKEGGASISSACSEQVSCRRLGRLDLGTTCMTPAGTLASCKRLVHIVTRAGDLLKESSQMVHEMVATSLEDVKYQEMTSVALLVCDSRDYDRSRVKECVQYAIGAVLEFLQYDFEHKVREVMMVSTDAEVRELLVAAVTDVTGKAVEAVTASDGATSPGAGAGQQAGPPRPPTPTSDPAQGVILSVYGTNQAAVDLTTKDLSDKAGELVTTVMVGKEGEDGEQSLIAGLSQDQYDSIKDLQNQFAPWIVLDLQQSDLLNYVEISGRRTQVSECESRVREILRGAESGPSGGGACGGGGAYGGGACGGAGLGGDEAFASSLASQENFCWEQRLLAGNWEPLPRDVSEMLEIAYQDRQPWAEVELPGRGGAPGDMCKVDFSSWRLSRRDGRGDSTVVRRKGGDGSATSPQGPSVPLTWTPMSPDDRYTLVELEKNSSEYQVVEADFSQTCSNYTIHKIERVQSPALYTQYRLRLEHIKTTNSLGDDNEHHLYHGTSEDTLGKINTNGFNRSYCGKNATMFGRGVYFATEARYSARIQYSPASPSTGLRYIYKCLVATGEVTQGQSDYLEPPPKETNNPNIRFDSVVDSVRHTEMYVVFHDAQAYPEYLITFN